MSDDDSIWTLRPWMYDGQMNADHYSGEMGFQNNGTELMVSFRANGRTWCGTVSGRALRELLKPEKEGSDWAKHGESVKLRADSYARDGALRDLEPECHLRWTDNYPGLFPSTTSAERSPEDLSDQHLPLIGDPE